MCVHGFLYIHMCMCMYSYVHFYLYVYMYIYIYREIMNDPLDQWRCPCMCHLTSGHEVLNMSTLAL